MDELIPPRTSIYSLKSLKWQFFSNSSPPPGAIERKNPKSICKILPVLCSNILPLCLSLIYKK
jgi:hypothetical protein